MTAKKRAAKKRGKKRGKQGGRQGEKQGGRQGGGQGEKQGGKQRPSARGVDVEAVRRAALALPGVEEGTSYGTPAFRVKKKLFLRLHQDGDDLVVKLDDDVCEMLLATEPDVFHKTPHYEGHPYLLARLAVITVPRLVDLIEDAWQLVAPAGLRATRQEGR